VEHVAGEDNNAFDLLSRGGSVAHSEDDFIDGTSAAIQITGEPFVYDYSEADKRAAAVRVVTETALANDGNAKTTGPKFGPRDTNVAEANGEPFTFELPRDAYPSHDSIGEAQDSVSATEIKTHQLQKGREGSAHAGLWVTKDDDVYVPDADKLRMRCAIVAHQGAGLHRKVDAMYTSVRAAKCWWPSMRETLKDISKLCMCCVWTMEGKRIPRATVETLYATKAGEAVTMDFLYIGPSDSGLKYILVLKDMCSQRVRLVNCAAADSGTATDAMIEWCADFGTPDLLVSDQGAHFINSTLEEVNRILGIEHHWTTPYNARSNGSVERVNREYLKAIRAMRIETKTPLGRWPDLTHVIQYGLNTQPLQCLNGLSALEVDGARSIVGPLGYALRTGANIQETEVTRFDPKTMAATVARLRKATTSMQAMATDNKKERAKRARERRERLLGPKKKTARKAKSKGDIAVPEDGNQTFWFHQGQFVMVAERSNKDRKSKLEAKWRGPYVIEEMVTDHRARVRELTLDEKKNKRAMEVASDRMRLWAERDYLVPHNVLEGAQYASDVFEIESFHDWRPSALKGETDKFQLLCKWKGYELDRGDEGWVNLDDVYATAYRLVNGMGGKGWEGTELTTKLKKHIAALEAERTDGK
jgi:transposase InsO family protein